MPEGVTCREVIDFLDAYSDGTLLPARRAAFDEHLDICSECRGYLAEYRATIRLTRSLRDDADCEKALAGAPPKVLDAVRRALEH